MIGVNAMDIIFQMLRVLGGALLWPPQTTVKIETRPHPCDRLSRAEMTALFAHELGQRRI